MIQSGHHRSYHRQSVQYSKKNRNTIDRTDKTDMKRPTGTQETNLPTKTTITIEIFSPKQKKKIPIQALIDSGATNNFISAKLVNDEKL